MSSVVETSVNWKLKYNMEKISSRIYSVGVNDQDKVLFEGLWPIPYGVSYNSYLVVDEKIALIDTSSADSRKSTLQTSKRCSVAERSIILW